MAAMRGGFFAALVVLSCAQVMRAQQPAAKSPTQAAYAPSLTFDIASVRESKPGDSVTVSGIDPPHNSEVKFSNYDVSNLLAAAYGVDHFQIVGLPDWAGSHFGPFFTVEAKSDDSVDAQLAKLTDKQARLEKQHMLQLLLADRFQLKAHWETREGPIYELVVSKNGPKLNPGGSMPPSPEELQNWGDKKLPPIYQRGNGIKGYEYIGHQCAIEWLAEALSAQMGEPVIDKTGLSGTYDFVLQYRGRGPDASDDPSVWPPLLAAVPDELGLKMQPAKGQRQVLIIDHIERPSEN
jgi:uncharacterized protein (TIGR03435 family)